MRDVYHEPAPSAHTYLEEKTQFLCSELMGYFCLNRLTLLRKKFECPLKFSANYIKPAINKNTSGENFRLDFQSIVVGVFY
jgi:hypothetical protein